MSEDMNTVDSPAFPSILALVIGINSYPYRREYENLNGAEADADHFEDYLKGRLAESSGRQPKIISLRNATREEILQGFSSLQTDHQDLKGNVAIIIFYAGHGARTKKPTEWTDWQTDNDEIEMICPSDIGKVEGNSPPIEGIYDRTISALLNKLSMEMGSNITLIMDCCCSGGISRGDKETADDLVREMFDPPEARATTDGRLCKYLLSSNASLDVRGGAPAHGFSGKLQGSHVLLAACGPNETASESRQFRRGVFSRQLLEVLKKEDVRTLTYTLLMHKLKLFNRRQTPRCQGHGVNSRLFRSQEGGSDWSFILTHNEDNIITLEAGDAQGITVGSVLSVHTTNLTDSPPIGKLQVTSVCKFSSILGRLEPFTIPNLFYCKILILKSANSTIKVYCKNREWLSSTLPHDFRERSGVLLVDTVQKCDLELVVSNGRVSFCRHSKLVTPYLDKCIRHDASADAADSIQNIVCATRTFYYHLTRSAIDNSTLARIELKMLTSNTSSTASHSQEPPLIPCGENLISKERATIVIIDEEDGYGMTIINESKHCLYPFVFYFDPTDLTIQSWYPPLFDIAGGSLNESDASDGSPVQEIGLLRPGSSLPIGHGESNVWPWGFSFSNGDTRDLGFFRVFLSTRPMPSFFSMMQDSPFALPSAISDTVKRGGGTRDPSRVVSRRGVYALKDGCSAKMVTIVQTSESEKKSKNPLSLLKSQKRRNWDILARS